MNIPLTKPAIDASDIAVMERAIHEHAIAQGSATVTFSHSYADFLGLPGAVSTNSGTSALLLALKALGVGKGREVVLPSYTCLAVLHAVVMSGAVPKLVDCAYRVTDMDYNLKVEDIEAEITDNTAAIIVPHMFGVPAPVEQLTRLSVPIIEDITLSLGAFRLGKRVGTFGNAAVCSFHESKMAACGEGGVVAFSSNELLERAVYLNGWQDEQPALRLSDEPIPAYELRYNFRMTDLAASLGINQLAKIDVFIKKRRELAARYRQHLSHFSRVQLPTTSSHNVFFRFLVAVPPGRPSQIIRWFAEAGIEVGRGVFPPLHYYLRGHARSFVGAERAVDTLVSIPLYPALTDGEVDYLLAVTRRVFARAGF